MYYCGIDIGSRTSKIAVVKKHAPVFMREVMTGLIPGDTALQLEQMARKALNIAESEELPLIATGYGRNTVKTKFRTISEISCHARGVHYYFPQGELVIDIGGQDSKGILVDNSGKVLDFVMNDRCAAGSGRFLEKLAEILEIRIDELGSLVSEATKVVEINSTCVVFAESEIIGQIAQGTTSANIAAGVHLALARRIRNLVSPLLRREIVFTGGVARNSGMIAALEEVFNHTIMIPENPVITGALGAALIAEQEHEN
ncbi:MAG: acyl-CoA dehydratase activase [Candidatus Cloacimonetes bacterium]|nr:acyl-CoA dehydratase activase [Candidatus Cloacimonadota bacterium]